jgi:CRISPR-associated endoribonuclease Cas6
MTELNNSELAVCYVGSILPELIQALKDSLLPGSAIRLGPYLVAVESVTFEAPPEFDGRSIVIRMLSPITAYSTFEKPDGSRMTHYFKPSDEVYIQLLLKNCVRKYEAFFNQPYHGRLDFRPLHVSGRDKVVTAYRELIINAWNGVYRLSADREMQQFLYDVGLGPKSGQGFGMFATVNRGG